MQAQLNAVQANKIIISYDKTVHIIFPSSIKYAEKGNDYIAVDVDDKSNNTLRIKAVEEAFPGETNVTVVLSNGGFYTYDVVYSNVISSTSYKIEDEILKPIKSDFVDVNSTKATHLIFPKPIVYMDYGNNESIEVTKAGNANNILRVQAISTDFPETSLSVVCDDKQYYSYNIAYNEKPQSHNYKIGNTDNLALFERPNTEALEELCAKALKQPTSLYNVGINKYKMAFAVQGIYIRNNTLFISCKLENKSSINYNIEFLKFTLKDKKTRKNTSVQEDEIVPLMTYKLPQNLHGKTDYEFVIALPKFTIPDAKNCHFTLFEKEGGRHLSFQISNSEIINAASL